MTYSVEKTLPVAWLDEKLVLLYSTTAGIRTSDLPHSITMSKNVPRPCQRRHRVGYFLSSLDVC